MDIKNFAILKGDDVTIEKGEISLAPPKKTKKGETEVIVNRPPAEIRSDFLFNNGTIEMKFKTDNTSSGLLLMFNSQSEEGVLVGLTRHYESFIIGTGTSKINPLVTASSLKNYKLNEEHNLKVEVKGSIIKLFMNQVLLCETSLSIKESPIQFRLSSEGSLEVWDVKAHSVKPKVFVVMQFSIEYNELYEEVIRPVVEQFGFECVRADEFYTSTPIIKDIIESIKNSIAIIAEITPDNPNVFYEIGYSHAINKPTILLCDKKREKLPFDLSSFRTLFYENSIGGKKKVETSLKKYLGTIR